MKFSTLMKAVGLWLITAGLLFGNAACHYAFAEHTASSASASSTSGGAGWWSSGAHPTCGCHPRSPN